MLYHLLVLTARRGTLNSTRWLRNCGGEGDNNHDIMRHFRIRAAVSIAGILHSCKNDVRVRTVSFGSKHSYTGGAANVSHDSSTE